MMTTTIKIFFLLPFLFLGQFTQSQETKELFRSDEILEITITLPLKKVINDTKERKRYDSKLSYTLADGTVFVHNLNVQVRGKTRALRDICTFPPLKLDFHKKDANLSIFTGQNKLKLVTHCKTDKYYEEYYQKEYIIYKMYQKVSPYSFNVRLCHITYIDSDKPTRETKYYGFLIESIKDVAKRNDMKVFKDSIMNQESVNKDNLDKLVMFQYLIGNLDWSIPTGHNIKLIVGKKGSLPLAVPYDFDYAGMVDTPYAVPPPQTNLSDVKTRFFRGFCRMDKYKSIFDFYNSISEELYNDIYTAGFLTDKTRNSMNKYLDEFYRQINDPKQVDKRFIKACKVKHKHAHEISN